MLLLLFRGGGSPARTITPVASRTWRGPPKRRTWQGAVANRTWAGLPKRRTWKG